MYGSREAAIHSFDQDSEFPVYSRRIKSLQRQSLVIDTTKLISENYYSYDTGCGENSEVNENLEI
jgi:hypothetical protein